MTEETSTDSRCAYCEVVITGDDLLCGDCLIEGIRAHKSGPGIVEIVFPECAPIIYEVCAECGRYVDCTDDRHPCPNWEELRGQHPSYQIGWLRKTRELNQKAES